MTARRVRAVGLELINWSLVPVEALLTAGLSEPRLPVVFVVGLPRTGTTLTGQVLATAHRYGYPSNLLARFWRAPALGGYLDRACRRLTGADRAVGGGSGSFRSHYGRTSGPWGLHEFGYYWDRWFDRGQTTHRLDDAALEAVPADALRRSLAGLERSLGAPLLFVNNTWCTLQADYLSRELPRSLFVVCERDPIWVAQSLLRGRQERKGDRGSWWSVRPSAFAELRELPWHRQIGGQVAHLMHEQEEALGRVPVERQVRVGYRDLCRDPGRIAARVREAAARLQDDASWDGPPSLGRTPSGLEARDHRRIPEGDLRRLEEGLAAFSEVLP